MDVARSDVAEVGLPSTLFGTNDPRQVVAQARAIARSLGEVLAERGLVSRISGREYVVIEGWTLLGSMVGVFAEVEWSRPTADGYEARAVARTMGGRVVGAAEAECSRSEANWRGRDGFALRSMAQTRAVSKALRLPLGFIVELAGYAATPAEEMDRTRPVEERPRVEAPRVRGGRPPSAAQLALRDEIEAAAAVRGLGREDLRRFAEEAHVEGGRATLAQLRKILAAVEALPMAEEEVLPDDGGSTDAADNDGDAPGDGYGG